MFRSISGTKRAILFLLVFLLALFFVLPKRSQGLLQFLGDPVAEVVALPLRGLAALTGGLGEFWNGYIALHQVHADNQQLRREIEYLRGQNNDLREAASATRRLERLLGFKERNRPQAVAAQVMGRDSTNWYRGVLLDRGERSGIQTGMGVMTEAGMVGQVVKTTSLSAVVLLVTDPNIAVTALIQRTRDEGIVSGTPKGFLKMKYIPLLSTVRKGDVVVTSGLAGMFPKGVMIGVVKDIEKIEGEPFQAAELAPAVDFSKLEEVLVVTALHRQEQPAPVAPSGGGASSRETTSP